MLPTPKFRVWPVAEVLAIFRFYGAGAIDFDIEADRVVIMADPALYH